MNRVKLVALAASVSLAVLFTFSCSGEGGGVVGEGESSSSLGGNSSSGGNNPSNEDGSSSSEGSSSSDGSSSSGGSNLSSSSIATTQFDGDEFIDSRDGKRYKFEVAPNGHVWMRENLNYSDNNTLGWCYVPNGTELGTQGADGDGCNRPYGRVYTQETAMSNICPADWHLPSVAEWDEILGRGLMSSDFYVLAGNFNNNSQWPPLGWRNRTGYVQYDSDDRGYYWTSQSTNFYLMVNDGTPNRFITPADDPASPTNDYFSVRCLMNEGICGEVKFDLATKSCCGGILYNPATESCSKGVIYNPDTEGICDGVKYYLATEKCCKEVSPAAVYPEAESCPEDGEGD